MISHNPLLFNGADRETEILARYNLNGFKPAVVLQPYGKGKVILSGVHYEDSA